MNIKKFFRSLILTVLILAVVAGGFTVGNFITTGNLPDSLSALLDAPPEGKMNILLMGLDEGKTRADTIMLASINSDDKTVKILSIPRDTRVKVGGHSIKINSTMGYKRREELMIEKIKEITGMPIHYYAEVDFAGFIEIMDILGGVDYNVPYDMDYDDPVQNLSIHLKAGMQHLDGKECHDYVRFRQNNDGSLPGNYALGDPGRIEAQQAFLKEIIRQKMSFKYIIRAPQLAKSIFKYVTTNFTISDGLKYVKMLKNIDMENDIKTFVLPGGSKTIYGASYYIYDAKKTEELVKTEFGY
ncbi:MAG: LCP family protein [Clostridia bacterium]|nr:LCP family protein [Clostridia bacterium]